MFFKASSSALYGQRSLRHLPAANICVIVSLGVSLACTEDIADDSASEVICHSCFWMRCIKASFDDTLDPFECVGSFLLVNWNGRTGFAKHNAFGNPTKFLG